MDHQLKCLVFCHVAASGCWSSGSCGDSYQALPAAMPWPEVGFTQHRAVVWQGAPVDLHLFVGRAAVVQGKTHML